MMTINEIKKLMKNVNVVVAENNEVITIKVVEEEYENEIDVAIAILKENGIEFNPKTYLSLHEDAIYWVNVNK